MMLSKMYRLPVIMAAVFISYSCLLILLLQLLRLAHAVEVGFTRQLPYARADPMFHHDPFAQ